MRNFTPELWVKPRRVVRPCHLKALTSAVALNPEDTASRFNLAVIYLDALHDREAAIKRYRVLRELEPGLAEKFRALLSK